MRYSKISHVKKLILGAFVVFLVIKYAIVPLHSTLKRNTCQSIHNVLFLKTHKTGGSSVSNILFRFAKSRGLTVALPRKQIYSFYWPWSFQVNFVDNSPEERPNILCSHARYNQNTLQSFMPPGTKFITILRHPLSRFESAFLFEDFPAFLGIPASVNPFQHFFEQFEKFKPDVNSMYTLRNGMSFDLGLEPDNFEDTAVIRNFISSIERDFDLVLLMEYYEESLVLLKQLFCWSLEDILYLKHNSRLQSLKKHHIPRQFRNKFLEWNKADLLLYEHFNQTFWIKVNSQDENFWSRVRLLKQKSFTMAKECLLPGEHKDASKTKTAAKLILNPRVRDDKEHLCQDLVKDEDGYLTYFRDIQLNE